MKILVTGGAGFLGSHIVSQLLAISNDESRSQTDISALIACSVKVFDIQPKPSLKNDEILEKYMDQIEWIVGDVTSKEKISDAIQGCDAVIHCAAASDHINLDPLEFDQTNVVGTKNVIASCKENNVKSLIYTSCIDIVIGREGANGLNEETSQLVMEVDPDFATPFVKSKTLAENAVLEANGSITANGTSELLTCSVRPVALYGPGDPYTLLETLRIARDLGTRNLFRFGDGKALRQMAYVGNIAHMHLCCLQRLRQRDGNIAGQVFFGIDQTKVRNHFDFMRTYEAHMRYKIPTVNLPDSLMKTISAGSDAYKKVMASIFGSFKEEKSAIQTVHILTIMQWFNTDKAKRLLDYKPIYSPLEARQLSKEYLDTLESEGFVKGTFDYGDQYEYYDDGSLFYPDEYVETHAEEITQQELEKLLNDMFYYDDFTETYYSDEEYREADFDHLGEEFNQNHHRDI